MNMSRMSRSALLFALLVPFCEFALAGVIVPELSVSKYGEVLATAGYPATYGYMITNGGDTELELISMNDSGGNYGGSGLGDLTSVATSAGCAVLAPGASCAFNLIYIVEAGDPDPLVNLVDVIYSPVGSGQEVIASDEHVMELFQPSVQVEKTGGILAHVGAPVTYEITITNDGSPDSPDLVLDSISDSLLGDLTGAAFGSGCDALPAGSACTFSIVRVVEPFDPDPLENSVAVHYHPIGFESPLSSSDSHITELFQPAVQVIKDGPEIAQPGETITYHFTIINPSSPDSPNLVLTSVTDDVLGPLAPPVECDLLPPGGSCSFDVAYTIPITATDPLVNVVTVHSHPEGFPNDITDDDDHTLAIERLVSVEACKLEDVDADPDTAGDRVPVPGWTMQLTTDGVILDEQLTGDDGCYRWEGLEPRAPDEYYAIHEIVPPDWFPWTPTHFVCDPIPADGACSYTFVNSRLFTKELTSGPDRDGSVFFEDFASVEGLTLNGDAFQDGSVLRLTSAISGQTGNAFTASPLMLGPGGSFSTHFAFQISNPGGLFDEYDFQQGADGLTFIVQNDPAGEFALGGAGAGIGYSGISNSLTVEFDSWWNDPDYFDVGDLDGNHIGVGINGVVGSEPTVAVPDTFNDGTVFHAWIDYDGMAGALEVRLSTTPMRPAAATLIQGGLDLPGLLGGTTAYVGFTSGTGAAWGDHDILYWHFMGAIDRVVPINVEEPTAYDFTITWNGDEPVLISDRVPAEWDVTHIEFDGSGLPLDCGEDTDFVGPYGEVIVSRGGKPGKKCNSDTGLLWMPGDDNTLNVQTLARCHEDGKGKKGQGGNTFCRPTSCGALYLNYGAVALETDPAGELVLDDEGNPIVVAGPTEPICLAAVDDVNGDGTFAWDGTGDEDGDGISDIDEACGECRTDPCLPSDADGDGVADPCDNCPYTPNPGQEDSDGDGVGDACDNCPDVYNPGQEDHDGNGIGDACEACPCFIGISLDTPYFLTVASGIEPCPDGSSIVSPVTYFNFIDSIGIVGVGYQEYCDAPTEYSCGGGPAGLFSLSQTQYETCLVGPGWPPSDPD